MRDGGNTPSADLPMGTQKHTGVGNATARTNYAAAGQVQDNSLAYAATTGDDTILATLSPAITAYAAGQLWCLKIGGTNTGAGTLNVNSVGADAIKKGIAGDLDIEAGDLPAGRMALFAHDGTNVQLLNAPEFPSGTEMVFHQTAAPVGWTKDTNYDDYALRVTSGTVSDGGSVAFETAFASQSVAGTVGDTAISINQMPLHGHIARYSDNVDSTATQSNEGGFMLNGASDGNEAAYTGTPNATLGNQIGGTGGGQTHTHTFSGTAIDLDVQFTDVIIAVKD
jgi:microcystin-dependent protein